MKTRIRYKNYALIDRDGKLWDDRISPTRAGIYAEYGSMSSALRDGLRLKAVTISFNLTTP